MARNSPLALAICAAAFPENSVALLILVIGPLIELPTLALAANLRLHVRRKQEPR
jgi:ACR3 family arsenite efflux pump ArsB